MLRPPVLAGCIFLVVTGCVETSDAVVGAGMAFQWETSGSDSPGAMVWRIRGEAPLRISTTVTVDLDTADIAGIAYLAVSDAGEVVPVSWGFYDDAHWLRGDGLAYAGGPSGTHRADGPPSDVVRSDGAAELVLPWTSGYLVACWARLPGLLAVRGLVGASASVEDLGRFDAEAAQFSDFRGGYRAGAPAAAVIHAADAVDLLPRSRATLGLLEAWISADPGRGDLVVSVGDAREDINLVVAGTGTSGVADRVTRVLGGDGPFQATVDYAGSGRSARVFLLACAMPADSLPAFVADPGIWGN